MFVVCGFFLVEFEGFGLRICGERFLFFGSRVGFLDVIIGLLLTLGLGIVLWGEILGRWVIFVV